MIPKTEVLLLQRKDIYVGKQDYLVKTESSQYKVTVLGSDTKNLISPGFGPGL